MRPTLIDNIPRFTTEWWELLLWELEITSMITEDEEEHERLLRLIPKIKERINAN